MKRLVLVLSVAAFLQGCAVLGTTPEAQITQGAQTHTAATTLATALLERRKITTAQAVSYRAMLGTASAALDGSAKTLANCRATTNSAARPDPCQQAVTTDVNLALRVLTEIEKTLLAQDAAK